ncbi:hypothetical protein D3C77_693910 [compost metagenome]
MLVQQAGNGFRRAVAAGEAGAAGDQHHLHLLIGDPGRDLRTNLVQVVFKQYTRRQAMAGFGQAINKHLARGVGFQGTGVTDR